MYVDVDAAVVVPVNILPLIDDTDFKTIETAVAYNAAGLALKWNFVTTAGVQTQTAVTPTTSGVYDWTHLGGGMYSIEIPASGGGSINNDTEGFGWFSGVATGVLPWRGPIITFRAAGLNDKLIDSAYDTTRGLAGTALPAAAAEAAGGLYTQGSGAGQLSQSANGELGVVTLTKTLTTYTGNTPQTGDAFARLGAPSGASVSADIASVAIIDLAIKAVTDLLVVAQAEPTGIPAVNDTPLTKLARLHQALRNRIDSDSNTGKKKFYDDSNNQLWEKDYTDAAGVYSETKGNAP